MTLRAAKVWAWFTLPLALGLGLSGCSLRTYALETAVGDQANFIPDLEHWSGSDLKKVTDRVYTFRSGWNRSLVVLTDEGVVVVDPFDRQTAQDLKAALDQLAPGKPVRTLFYSHYHLDHVVGGAALKPMEVVAHARCPEYWANLTDTQAAQDILPPTRFIEGDQQFTIGGVEFNLLYLGLTHTDTLYAFYLPGEKVLFTADFGLIKTVFPIGGPDMYFPGILKQMDRLAKLDFDWFIPSHFGYGTKADYLEAVGFQKDIHRLALESVQKFGRPSSREDYVRSFHYLYDPLKEKYGAYHGFEEEIIFITGRAYSGVLLGF
jgi:glyoxylase-like metal-dependent hydrolase (beta-lactamase superfamily II)